MTVNLVTSSPKDLAKVGHWFGSLSLTMGCNEEYIENQVNLKTVLKNKQQTGPYTVQRPLYPEAANKEVCHLIVLHPPGGLVEGDTLQLDVECLSGSHTVITMPSAGKVYQCEKDNASQTQSFKVHPRAKLEWFPQEMILYNKSRSILKSEINLHDDAQFCGWEMVCLGREIAGDYFSEGRVMQNIELRRNKKPLLIERLLVDQLASGETESIRSQNWGLAKQSVSGTFLMTGVNNEQFERAREFVNNQNNSALNVGITLLEDVLVCRALSNQSRHLKSIFTAVWLLLREEVLGVAAHEPRIWST